MQRVSPRAEVKVFARDISRRFKKAFKILKESSKDLLGAETVPYFSAPISGAMDPREAEPRVVVRETTQEQACSLFYRSTGPLK